MKRDIQILGRREPPDGPVVTVELDGHAYGLIRRIIQHRVEREASTPLQRGVFSTPAERDLNALMQFPLSNPIRLTMTRPNAESACDWLEKVLDIVGAIGNHWPDSEYILAAAQRGVDAFRSALSNAR